MNVFTYIRVSSKGQVEGDGPERQRLACAAFAQTHGLHTEASFFDAYTGTSEERPAFTSMLQALRSNQALAPDDRKVTAVVVERLDRLARELMTQELLLRELRAMGIKLFVTDQGTLDDIASNDVDPSRILIRQILGALAQWEKSALVKKLKSARKRAEAAGRYGGRKPYGHADKEKEALIQIVELDRKGLSATQITQKLNSCGYPSRSGKWWSRGTIEGILARTKAERQGEKKGIRLVRKELASLIAKCDYEVNKVS